MSNPDRLSSASHNNEPTEWDSLSGVEVTPISVPKDEISKIELSDDPMGEDRQDKRVDVTDASGMEKRTSNLMLGYNKKGVEIGKTYLSLEEFREKALESLEEDTEDEVVYFIRKDEGKRFAEPREVIDDMLAAIVGAGPEATFANDDRFPNQDARSVRFGGPNGEVQRGVFMLGNEGIQMPNGVYAEVGTIDSAMENYAKVTKKEVPVPPPGPSEDDPEPPREIPLPPEQTSDTKETEGASKKDLHQATVDLAELYARSRRLVAGPGTRERFEEARKEYQQLLAEHLSNLGRTEYSAGYESLSVEIQSEADKLAAENVEKLIDFVGGDLEHPTKTPEEIEAKREELRREAEAKMKERYPDMVGEVETAVTSKVIEEYAKARTELEEATIDALDNGSICRKVVSKIITNKWVKRALVAAAAAGLAVAAVGIGHGIAAGTLAVSLGYTAGSAIAGAVRGGLAGFFMSRQDSKTSAIRGYGSNVGENVEERVESGEHITAETLASEAMSDYAAANRADLRSNRLKTAVSTGAGVAIGAAASGIHVDNIARSTAKPDQIGTKHELKVTDFKVDQVQVGTTPVKYEVDLGKIDVHEGAGLGEAFTDLGGDPSKISEAVKIANQLDASYGMVPGSNGVIPGAGGQVGEFAHTYPGTIDTWPKQAREYITQVAQKWAESGLIDATKIGGDPLYLDVPKPVFSVVETPIFSDVEKTVISYLPNLFYRTLVQAEAAAVSGIIGGTASQTRESEPQQHDS